jgi:predicted DCC family thiol-disulfide oxidoreductase YuxK
LKKKTVLIYDGDCGFCRLWISRWKHITGNQIEYLPYQEVGEHFPEISLAQFQNSIQLVEPEKKIYSGAEAVFRALAHNPSHKWPLKLYKSLPGFTFFSEFSYRIVANNRQFFSKVSKLFIASKDAH